MTMQLAGKKEDSMRTRCGRERPAWFAVAGLVLLGARAPAQSFDHSHAVYDGVLKQHVAGGRVDYKALKADSRALNRYLAALAVVPEMAFRSWGEPERLAFLVNLYNAATLRLILDHYPVKSIKDIGGWLKGPWDQPVVRLFGKRITLNNLEHDIVRKEYKEPRIHVALVCAAKGCPLLRSEAYTAARLNEQLDDQGRAYLVSSAGLKLDRANGSAHVSSIFKWYAKDFASVPGFVAKHSGQDLAGLRLRYLDYDWSLNEQER